MPPDNLFTSQRLQMVQHQLLERGIRDERVLNAMRKVPRHYFVPEYHQRYAYEDRPLSIGEDQTISQPYIVAFMTEHLHLRPDERVLEIGTGSGYQTAVLAELCRYVYSLERNLLLADGAGERLSWLGYDNVDIHIGDGSQGLADMSPFNAIIVTAAAPALPGPLCSQLSPDNGRMIIPVGDREHQELRLVVRRKNKISARTLIACKFVPLLGRYGFKDDNSSLV